MRLSRLLVLLGAAAGCGPSRHAREAGAVAAAEDSTNVEEDFQDLAFTILEAAPAIEHGRSLLIRSDSSGLRLRIVLGKQWTEGHIAGLAAPIYSGIITIASVESQGPGFSAELDSRYHTHLRPASSRPEVQFTATSLEGNPANLESGPTRIKIFFEPENEDDYAEAYLNIDLHAHRVEFAEKDFDYRPALVRAFAGHN